MYLVNALFHLMHITIITASLTLFLFKDFVLAHLILQALILSSWLIIGPLMNKPGVCVLTELHKMLGLNQQGAFPHSYIVYLVRKVGIKNKTDKQIDIITFIVFAICTCASLARFIFNV